MFKERVFNDAVFSEDDDEDPSRYYEDIQARELRRVYEGQAQIYQILQQIEQKILSLQKTDGVVQHQSGGQPVASTGGCKPLYIPTS